MSSMQDYELYVNNFVVSVYECTPYWQSIPYSGKFWQEKILANLASMHGFAKILFAIFINTESAVDAVHR